VLSSNKGKGVGLEYDSFGVAMVTSGSAQTPYRPAGLVLDVEGLDFSGPPVACPLYANRAMPLCHTCHHRRHKCHPRHHPRPHPPHQSRPKRNCTTERQMCMDICQEANNNCQRAAQSFYDKCIAGGAITGGIIGGIGGSPGGPGGVGIGGIVGGIIGGGGALLFCGIFRDQLLDQCAEAYSQCMDTCNWRYYQCVREGGTP
jgi:hypothetical protein